MLGVDYEPTELQKLWHTGITKKGYGRASGKSTFAVMEALKTAVENNNTRVEIISLGTGADYLLNIFRQRVNPNLYEYSEARRTVRLANGSEICFVNRDSDDRGRKTITVYDD